MMMINLKMLNKLMKVNFFFQRTLKLDCFHFFSVISNKYCVFVVVETEYPSLCQYRTPKNLDR